MKTIVVTGGAGFIGSHLCEALVKQGHHVISLDSYFTGTEDNHVSGVEYRKGHTKNIASLIPEKPDLIYHLGEYSRVAKSMEEPERVWDLNIVGTLGVVDFWKSHGCKLVYAGSSTKHAIPREDGTLGRDLSPYTWSKAINTELVRNMGQWFNLPCAISYFYNVYGPRERSDAYGTVIEIFRQYRQQGKPLPVRLPGTQERNYTHVLDTVDGLLRIGEQGQGDGYHLASPKAYTTVEVAQLFGGEIDFLPARKTSRPSTPIDTEKSTQIGWRPSHTLEAYIASISR